MAGDRKEEAPASAGGCFACGPEHPGGLRLAFQTDTEARTAWAETTVGPRFEGADGMVHGGIVATLLDEAMVHASRTVTPLAATASLRVRYRAPTPTGETVRIEAQVLWTRHGAIGCTARLSQRGRVLAEGEAVLMAVSGTSAQQSWP